MASKLIPYDRTAHKSLFFACAPPPKVRSKAKDVKYNTEITNRCVKIPNSKIKKKNNTLDNICSKQYCIILSSFSEM